MHAPNIAQNQRIDQVLTNIPQARHVLHSHGVDTAGHCRYSLAEAARSVSSTSDEMLAGMEARMRRSATRLRHANRSFEIA